MENQDASLAMATQKIRSHFGIELQGILLYGSRARNTHRLNSDFDIGVMCDRNIPGDERWLVAQDIAATINRDVDLIDLWQAPTVLRKEAVECGVWLYQRDRIQCEEFVTHTLSQYQNLNLERRDILAGIEQRLRNTNG